MNDVDVFISYARADADWVSALAGRLEAGGVRVYFDMWDLEPGDPVVPKLEAAIRRSKNAILVLSSRSVNRPWVREEYAALLHRSVVDGLRFIPVIYGDVEIPPFAGNRVPVDFRNVNEHGYDDNVADIIRVIRGRTRPRVGVPPRRSWDAAQNILAPPARPPSPPDEPAFVICYVSADAEYEERLADRLRKVELPTWSVANLMPGDDKVWTIRQQLQYAVAVVVLMSPQSQASTDITRMILEGQAHGRVFFPILLDGVPNYQLANSWYFDGRTGNMPGPAEFDRLRRLYESHRNGKPLAASQILPAPLASPAVAAIHIPGPVARDQLGDYLKERELELADLMTTSLLLDAAGRLGSGWLRRKDADAIPADLLAWVDKLWSNYSEGRYGFAVQRALVTVRDNRHSDFVVLSVGYGWCASAYDVIPKYREFIDSRAVGQRGFFPTLRNPQVEQYVDWYDQWTQTVLAVHLRLAEPRLAR